MTIAQAEQALKDLGLEVRSVPDTSVNQQDIGKVLRTDPQAGTEVEAGSTIQIYYAFTGELKSIPNLITNPPKTLDEAEFMLKQEGFELDRENIKYADSSITKDRVVKQEPAAGSEYPVGTKVVLTLSTGVAPKSDLNIRITLPDRNGIDGALKVYINNELVDSKTVLLNGAAYEYKLTGSGSNKKVTVRINNWQVYSATVDFTKATPIVTNEQISNPDDYAIYLPNVIGETEADGIALVTSAGFGVPQINYRETDSESEAGKIVDMSPTAGSININASYYPRDTKITITVLRYTPPPTTLPPTTTAEPVNATTAPTETQSVQG
jgi:beta-lactam-binding protein with PASTA domain